jgi:chromosome partitioning protein
MAGEVVGRVFDCRFAIFHPQFSILNLPLSSNLYSQSSIAAMLHLMRTIALMNQKGGVGKTTTTANLGAALAELGHRVCMIDLDPQAHLTINYGVDPSPDGADPRVGLYHVLVDERPLAEAMCAVGERLWLVPSSIDLAAAEVELVTVIGRETLLRNSIEQAIAHAGAGGGYDFILMDCPPSLGILTINALSAASEVIIPMQPHFLALQGVAKLLETVQLVNKRMNPKLKVSGIALTMYDSQTKLTGEVVGEMRTFIQAAAGKPLPWAQAKIFDSKIRRNIKLAESPSFGQTILQYDSSSNGAADYRALAAEVAGMGSVGSVMATPVVTVNSEIAVERLAAAHVEAGEPLKV